MNKILPLLFVILCTPLPVFSGEKKADIKWDMAYLEKTWNLKFKSAKVDEKTNEIKILLEFTKAVDNLPDVRQVFQAKSPNGKLLFFFFDEDNIAVGKCMIRDVEGEITGKPGEAFRIFLTPPDKKSKFFATAQKVSVRPSDDEKLAPKKSATAPAPKTIAGKGESSDIKWDMDYLDKTWGIKFKAAKVDEKGNEAKILLDFTKDLENLQEVRQVFQAKPTTSKLLFYFFDEDNVAFGKSPIAEIEGELTGRAGEAFRIHIAAPASNPKAFTLAKKVSARPNDDVKTLPKPKQITNAIGMKFVWIPPGNFVMGSPSDEANRDKEETQHQVTLTKGFYMAEYLVTQEQWKAIMGDNPSHFKGEKNLPVDSVSWQDCQNFIAKLRKKDNKAYRLPTEAEWEYCARAGTTTPYYVGETISPKQANFQVKAPDEKDKKKATGKTTPVGKFAANPWGLFDMHGNVYQWCQDWYGKYTDKDVTDPEGPDAGEYRMLRGGSWNYGPQYCRSANRNYEEPGERFSYIGCRVCFFAD